MGAVVSHVVGVTAAFVRGVVVRGVVVRGAGVVIPPWGIPPLLLTPSRETMALWSDSRRPRRRSDSQP